MWSADVEKTRDRCKKSLEYYKREGLNADDFHCSHYEECLNSQTKCNVVKQYSTANVEGIYNLFPIYELIHKYQLLNIMCHKII